jgi:hypothetical protein
MAITNGYATLVDYKARFFGDTGDTKDDAAINSVIEVVSRKIDEICWQRFYTTTEIRYFTAEDSDILFLPRPVSTLTALSTDHDGDRAYENLWVDGTDFDKMPFNAALDGEPYKWIETIPNGNYKFPVGISRGVKISGKFGWAAVPRPIIEACLLGSHRLMKRMTTPLGVSAAAAVGQLAVQIPSLEVDPDFVALLKPYTMRY